MKNILLISTILMIMIVGCSSKAVNTSTSSHILVIDKSYSNDYKEKWIMAYDPNNSTKEKALKIMVEESMVWNLIEKDNKKYLASYYKEGNNPWILQQIEHLGDDKTLR